MGRKKSKRGAKRKRQGHMIPERGTRQAQKNSAGEENIEDQQSVPAEGSVPTEGNVPADGSVPTEGNVPAEGNVPVEENVPVKENVPVEDNAQVEKKVVAQVPLTQLSSPLETIQKTPTQSSRKDAFSQPSTSAQHLISGDAPKSQELPEVSATTVDVVTMQENISVRDSSPIRHFNRLKQSTVVKYKRSDQNTTSGAEQKKGI